MRVLRNQLCCASESQAERAALLGYTSSGFRNLVLRQEESGEDKEAERKDLRSTVMQTLVWPYMQEVKVVDVHEDAARCRGGRDLQRFIGWHMDPRPLSRASTPKIRSQMTHVSAPTDAS